MTEILVGTLFMIKSMAFSDCVRLVHSKTEYMTHVILKAEKNDVQVLLVPNNKYRYGIHCTNGQMKVYRKERNIEE
jgi:ribosomal protein S24E